MNIETVRGPIDEALLVTRAGATSTGAWKEYWFEGELVRRDVTVSLQSTMPAIGTVGTFERYGRRWTYERP